MRLPKITLPQGLFNTRRRTIVIMVGLVLVALSLFYTWRISVDMKHVDEMAVEQLRRDELNAVEMWEDILHTSNIGGQMIYNGELLNKLAQHTNVPLIIADERLNVLVTNLSADIVENPERLRQEIMLMSENNKPISVSYGMIHRKVFTIYFGTT